MAAAEDCFRLSGRTAFKNILRLIPAVVIMAVTLNTLSCGNGLLTPVSSNSATPTATSTAGTGALAFLTNFNDGMVSSFTRNTTTGVLKRTFQVTAGAKKGPKGLAVTGSFLYVANHSDDNIYEFSVNPANGVLTPLGTPSISNGAGSAPDEIAIIPAGNFLYVTGFNNGSVTAYSINSGTGQLTKVSTLTGLVNPFGIAADSTSTFIFVADNGAGLVYAFTIQGDGSLKQLGLPVNDLGGPGGTPGFIAINPANSFLYVTDLNAGQLSVLGTSGGLAFNRLSPPNTTGNKPVGVGYAAIAGVASFVFTANQSANSMWSFQLLSAGLPAQPVQFGAGNVNAPTGLVVDPQNVYLYTTNQNAGTVSQFKLSTISAGMPPFVGSVSTESPANPGSGPFQIILAQ